MKGNSVCGQGFCLPQLFAALALKIRPYIREPNIIPRAHLLSSYLPELCLHLMATTTISHWRSFREAIMGSPRAPVETPQAPHKVGELVYATVLVESPMVAFKRICGDNISGKEARRNEKQRSNEEDQKIGDKGPRPCVILSTKHHKHNTKIEWEYELCLLTSFGGQAYSQLDGDLKRLALPVCQNSGQPDECADETRIPAFVITPPLKPRANSYLIGCPITRSGRCIVSPGGAAMEPEEVIRLRKYCDWIKRQKREVLST